MAENPILVAGAKNYGLQAPMRAIISIGSLQWGCGAGCNFPPDAHIKTAWFGYMSRLETGDAPVFEFGGTMDWEFAAQRRI